MRIFLLSIILIAFAKLNSQVYPSQNISLAGFISPNTSSIGLGPNNQRYSGCWAWYQSNKNKEYAISGGSSGTYFIDITNPATPSVSAYVPGKSNCIWREIKTYQNYCYVSSDDPAPNNFQIIDMQYLPDSVHVIHKGTTYIQTGHTLWVDNNKLYVGIAKGGAVGVASMAVFSLATPTAPVLLRKLNQDFPMITGVHDMYVRNDTVYASCEGMGLYMFKLNANNTFSQLGSFSNYASGFTYNHSSYLTQNGQTLVFCDEIPVGMPLRMVNVSNPANITPQSTVIPYPTSVPHNPYVVGNDHVVLSSYQDGLQIYNISNPASPFLAGYFDTHPQGGAPNGTYFNNEYAGNWGAYPWLPSGLIVANDMQNGVFILNPMAAYTATSSVSMPLSTVKVPENELNRRISIWPVPAKDKLQIKLPESTNCRIVVSDLTGHTLINESFSGEGTKLSLDGFKEGVYLMELRYQGKTEIRKFTVLHN